MAQDKIIYIQDYKAKVHAPKDSIKHKFGDIEIFRFKVPEKFIDVMPFYDSLENPLNNITPLLRSIYEICIWGSSKETPSLITFSEIWCDTEYYDKAAYRWDSDSILLFRAFNSSTKEDVNFRFKGDVLYINTNEGHSIENIDARMKLK